MTMYSHRLNAVSKIYLFFSVCQDLVFAQLDFSLKFSSVIHLSSFSSKHAIVEELYLFPLRERGIVLSRGAYTMCGLILFLHKYLKCKR